MIKHKRIAFTLVFLIWLPALMVAQPRYWVQFTDKHGTTFNPENYFCTKTLERRVTENVSPTDSTDFPLNESYIAAVNGIASDMGKKSRWLNAVAVSASKNEIKRIEKLPFVKQVKPISGAWTTTRVIQKKSSDENNDHLWDILYRQTERMGGRYFRDSSINGKGVRIAVFDAGFPNVDTHPAFEQIRKDGRIIATWDFTKNRSNVFRGNSHGTNVLSCIAGIHDGTAMGLATGAEFLLAITEVNSEPFSEEENWMAAMEWAYKNGADIISSSLGYTFNRYFPKDMDGSKSFVVKAASLAARKGMLVINAAGNDGDNDWKVIGTPADADSILSIGGISPETHLHINFSSYGPTADGRMKPNVSAFGEAVVAEPKGGVDIAYGTSFATPLVAGFAACAWQASKGKTAMEMLKEIEKSADLYPYFDYAHGYGVPQAGYFLYSANDSVNSTFSLYETGEYYSVYISYGLVKLLSGYNTSILFYSIEKPDGTLAEYGAARVYQEQALNFKKSAFKIGYKLNVRYLNYYATFELGAKEPVDHEITANL